MKRKFLNTAIRRFGYAHERSRVDDKIVDLLISAEALFLSDGSYIGEVKYRLSLRAALFLATESEVRRVVFDRMKAAYDLRSAVAHGGIYKEDKLPKDKDGAIPTIPDFVWQIQEYVRIALLKAVQLATQPNSPTELVKWDDLIFPERKP